MPLSRSGPPDDGAGAVDDHHVDRDGSLAQLVRDAGGSLELIEGVGAANTALDALQQCQAAGLPLGDLVAGGARETALGVLRGAPVQVDVVVIDRAGTVVGRA